MNSENTVKCKSKKFAVSERDFSSRVYIALKECSESLYWLKLLFDTEYLTKKEHVSIKSDCEEMKKMMSATTKIMNSKRHSAPSALNKTNEGGTTE